MAIFSLHLTLLERLITIIELLMINVYIIYIYVYMYIYICTYIYIYIYIHIIVISRSNIVKYKENIAIQNFFFLISQHLKSVNILTFS